MSVEEHLLELEPCEVSERREQHERPHLSAASTHPCAVRKGRISRQRRRRSNGLPCADGFVDANIVLVRKRTVQAGENHPHGLRRRTPTAACGRAAGGSKLALSS